MQGSETMRVKLVGAFRRLWEDWGTNATATWQNVR